MPNGLADRLREAQSALSAWYDQLNSYWKDAERVAQTFTLTEPVWISFRTEPQELDDGQYSRDWEHALAYCKLKGNWRLCYALGEAGDSDSFVPKPILDCSVEERKLALAGWPLLLQEMVERTEAEAEQLEASLGAFAEATSPFKSAGKRHSNETHQGPGMKVREVLKLLQSDGWYLVVTSGSHRQLKHPSKPGRVTVAGKPSEDFPPGTLNSILKQAGLKD